MGKRNKDRDINLNLTESALQEIIECVQLKAGYYVSDEEAYAEYVRFINVLHGYLTRFRMRKDTRNASRKQEIETGQTNNETESAQMPPLRQDGF